MPTYEYKCHKCAKIFDQLQSMKDKPFTKCIYCKGKVQRLIGSGAGLIFKGTGFYSTDYKKSPGSKDSKESKESKESKDIKKP